MDKVPGESVDVVWDLNVTPWPLEGDSFDEVHAYDVFEHLDDMIAVMEEVHRVSKSMAVVRVRVPFMAGSFTWTDITHRRGFGYRSFKYFSPDFSAFSYSKARFEVLEALYIKVGVRWIGRAIMKLANRYKYKYEMRYMYYYPADNISFVLRVIK